MALWGLAKKAVQDWLTGLVGLAAIGLYFAGVNFVWVLLGGGVIVMLVRNRQRVIAIHPCAVSAAHQRRCDQFQPGRTLLDIL